jgi:hypothetical protein
MGAAGLSASEFLAGVSTILLHGPLSLTARYASVKSLLQALPCARQRDRDRAVELAGNVLSAALERSFGVTA